MDYESYLEMTSVQGILVTTETQMSQDQMKTAFGAWRSIPRSSWLGLQNLTGGSLNIFFVRPGCPEMAKSVMESTSRDAWMNIMLIESTITGLTLLQAKMHMPRSTSAKRGTLLIFLVQLTHTHPLPSAEAC